MLCTDTSQILWAGSCRCPALPRPLADPLSTSTTSYLARGEAALRPSPEREPVLLNVYFPPWNNQREKRRALMQNPCRAGKAVFIAQDLRVPPLTPCPHLMALAALEGRTRNRRNSGPLITLAGRNLLLQYPC